jgi:hypothetical protein
MTAISIENRRRRGSRRLERARDRVARLVLQLEAYRRREAPRGPYWHEREAELQRQLALAQIAVIRLEASQRPRHGSV